MAVGSCLTRVTRYRTLSVASATSFALFVEVDCSRVFGLLNSPFRETSGRLAHVHLPCSFRCTPGGLPGRRHVNCPYAVDSRLTRQRGRNMKPTDKRTVQSGLTALLVIALALATAATAQVPVQVGAPLRPAVMGPSGGVSAGHPLTAAVPFSIPLKGGNPFDAALASLLPGPALIH